jgi:hypothetical protein
MLGAFLIGFNLHNREPNDPFVRGNWVRQSSL